MIYNFDKIINRRGTHCTKHDGVEQFLGANVQFPMWVADMDFLTPEYITQAIISRAEHGIFGYPLRQQGYYTSIVEWFERRHQWKIEKDWIIYTPGVVPAINMAVLAYTQPGDKIIVQPPVYFPFFSAVSDHNRTLIYNKLLFYNNRFNIDFDNLETLASQGARMLILSNPHNPGGSVWTHDELKRISDICLAYNMLILSDDIHCDLVYPKYKYTPIASISEEISNHLITMVAPSKTFNLSGFSTSSVIIKNPILQKQFNDVVNHLHLAVGNVFGNLASELAYSQGDDYVDQLMTYLQGNVDFLVNYANLYLPKIKIIPPEATFLALLDCRDMGLSDTKLNHFFLKKASVGMNTGIMFGEGGSGLMRMNIGCPRAILEKALNSIKENI